MNARIQCSLLGAGLALCAGLAHARNYDEWLKSTAAPYEEIAHVAVRQGVDEPVLLSMSSAQQRPKRILMLFPGLPGIMKLQMKDGHIWFALLGNYLLRSRAQFVDDETAAASVDAPTDEYCCFSEDFRLGATHAADVGRIVDALEARFPGAQIYLVGTSQGTVSVAALAVALGPRIAGAVMTSTLIRASRLGGAGLSAFDFAALKVPVLFVHHRDDGCFATPYYEVQDIAQKYHFALILVTGADNPEGNACEAFSYHGFRGREKEVAAAIMRWVKTGAVTPTIK
jgi:hypothetical protein